MKDNRELIHNFKNYILRNIKPSKLTTSHDELIVRCPYCGDSKNPHKAHLYIKTEPPFCFYCQKCNTSGIMNAESFSDFQFNDSELLLEIVNNLKESKKSLKESKNISGSRLQIKATSYNNYFFKLNYFNQRFGSNYTEQDLIEKFKGVLSLIDLIENNNIILPNTDFYKYLVSNLDAKHLGFLSSDHSHLICRDTTNTEKLRYYNLNLVSDKEMNTKKFYTIRKDINILSKELELNITEGLFDIIGVYTNIATEEEKESDSVVFSAACGKGYVALINHFLRMGFLNLKIKIYSDSDVDMNFYRSLKKIPVLQDKRIEIYYNTKNKDFGVNKNMIETKKIIIWGKNGIYNNNSNWCFSTIRIS